MNTECNRFRKPKLQESTTCTCGSWMKAARRADFPEDLWLKAITAPGMMAQDAVGWVGGQ